MLFYKQLLHSHLFAILAYLNRSDRATATPSAVDDAYDPESDPRLRRYFAREQRRQRKRRWARKK